MAQPVDTAKKIIPDSQLRFSLPSITAGNLKFTWPVGPEGFSRSGSAALGIHKYIGDNVVDVNVMHFDEGRIELTGTFPGLSSPNYMANLITVLTSRNKKVLHVPGVFPREQFVETDSYSFTHAQDNRDHSIEYQVTFVRVGAGEAADGFLQTSLATLQLQSAASAGSSLRSSSGISGPQGVASPSAGSRSQQSKSTRYFKVIDGVDTFRTISDYVYGTPDKTAELVALNQDMILKNNPGVDVTSYQLIYKRWPRGTKIAY